MNRTAPATVEIAPDTNGWGFVLVGDTRRRCYFQAGRFHETVNPGDRVFVVAGSPPGTLMALYLLGKGAVTA